MVDILLFLFILSAFIFLVLYGFVLFFLIWHQFITRKAPYVLIPNEILPEIFEALNIKDRDTVFDLGSGDGCVLFHFHKKMPEAKYIGIDISPWPVISSRLRKWKNYPNSNIEFRKGNILEEDLSQATHVFTYLSLESMNELLPKLERELKKGTTLVSCDYFFEKKIPEKIIDLKRDEEGRGKKLYVYKF